jgi:hypothetical protein
VNQSILTDDALMEERTIACERNPNKKGDVASTKHFIYCLFEGAETLTQRLLCDA